VASKPKVFSVFFAPSIDFARSRGFLMVSSAAPSPSWLLLLLLL